MREIKFRGYDGMDWVYSETIGQDKNDKSLWWILDKNDDWLVCTEPQQFTGLYDKEGNEIYIGDIVQIKQGNEVYQHEVIINDFMQVPAIDSDYGQDVLYKHNKACKVIGNVLEESLN